MANSYTSHNPKPATGKIRRLPKPRPAKVVTRADLDKAAAVKESAAPAKVPETGGPAGPEPTRYGDWEIKGRCIDF
ncbi:MAG: succinate dehydrogenase assembly factor 4 [Pseudomonadota bacterium]